MGLTNSKEEKLRLRSLNNSTLQRLKKRREEHRHSQWSTIKDNRIKLLLKTVETYVKPREMKSIRKQIERQVERESSQEMQFQATVK